MEISHSNSMRMRMQQREKIAINHFRRWPNWWLKDEFLSMPRYESKMSLIKTLSRVVIMAEYSTSSPPFCWHNCTTHRVSMILQYYWLHLSKPFSNSRIFFHLIDGTQDEVKSQYWVKCVMYRGRIRRKGESYYDELPNGCTHVMDNSMCIFVAADSPSSGL